MNIDDAITRLNTMGIDFPFKKSATERSGPCPFMGCGGHDRGILSEKGGQILYWCRQCEWGGTVIKMLMESKNMSAQEACKTLGLEYYGKGAGTGPRRVTSLSALGKLRKEKSKALYREITLPNEKWIKLINDEIQPQAIHNLWSAQGKPHRKYLRNRGLADDAIKRFGIGLILKNHSIHRVRFGLPLNPIKQGITFFQSITIPHFNEKGQVDRIRMRRIRPKVEPRYMLVPGGSTAPLVIGDRSRLVWLVVESELCSILVAQECGELIGVVGLGNASARPDKMTHEILTAAELILVGLDADDAGTSSTKKFWLKNFPNAKPWPCIRAKDPTDMRQAGISIKLWVGAGINYHTQPKSKGPRKVPPVVQDIQPEHQPGAGSSAKECIPELGLDSTQEEDTVSNVSTKCTDCNANGKDGKCYEYAVFRFTHGKPELLDTAILNCER